MELAVSLNPDKKVATWREDCQDNIKPSILKQMENVQYRGWYCCGQTNLEIAIAFYKWSQEHLGETDAHSIYKIAPIWIFPLEYQVPQEWQTLFL
jgi:hypothetical protein